MRIAVTSQNQKQVTAHAGRCRVFIVFEPVGGEPGTPSLVRLDIEQVFHECHDGIPQPLVGVNVLITGGVGPGLADRLRRQGIRVLVTDETDPERAVRRLLDGSLSVLPEGCTDETAADVAGPGRRAGASHGHGEGHGQGRHGGGGGCGCRCGH